MWGWWGEGQIPKFCVALRYTAHVIKSFIHKGLEAFFLTASKAGISPEMALRLEAWLGVEHGGRAEVWLRMQVAYDLAHVAKTSQAVLQKVTAVDDARFALAA